MTINSTSPRELIDEELDAVCGGLFDFGNIVIAPNIPTQVSLALVGTSGITLGNGGNASVAQLLGQASVSPIS